MRKIIKSSLLVLVLAALVSAFALVSFAASDDGILYEVYDESGYVIKYGANPEEFSTDIQELADAHTFKLLNELNIYDNSILVQGTEAAPKTINIDLAGQRLILSGKIESARVRSLGYSTLNIYSSVPGGHLSNIEYNESTATLKGDPLFNVFGTNSVLNCGRFETEDGVVYSGHNLTAEAVCIASCGTSAGESSLNLNGGTYIRVPTSDHRAFIMLTGECILNVNDANILTHGNAFRLTNEGAICTVENSVITGYNGSTPVLVLNSPLPANSANPFYGTLILKNSSVAAKMTEVTVEYDGDEEICSGKLIIEDGCIIEKSCAVPEAVELATIASGKTVARVNREWSLRGGSSVASYVNYNAETLGYELKEITPTEFKEASVFTAEDDVFTCYFKLENGTKETDVWRVGEKPVSTLSLPDTKKEGLYRADWFFGMDKFGAYYYSVGLTVDFDILYTFTSNLECHVYIPAFFMDDGYMDMVNSTFDGRICKSDEYVKVSVGEEEYYRIIIAPDENLGEIEVVIAGKDITKEIKGTFKINIADYIDRIISEDSENEKLRTAALDMAYLASLSYAKWCDGYESNTTYNRLSELALGVTLTSADSEKMAPYLSAKVDDGALKNNFAKAESELSVGLPIKFNLPAGFNGKVVICVSDMGNIYEVKDGKVDKETFITLRLPATLAAEKITVKAYGEDGNLISSDGTATGEYSFVNGYHTSAAEDKELYAAYVALGISLKAYLAG